MTLDIRPASSEDVGWVAEHLRLEDAREVETAVEQEAAEVVKRAWGFSSECFTARLSPAHRPFLVFGVDASGAVWMLATAEIRKAPLRVFKLAREWLDRWHLKYGILFNYADTRNVLHLRWLSLLGFDFAQVTDVGGVPFQFFYRRHPCVRPCS